MKKIISALVLGAAAVGFATADLKINANYRNGPDMFRYWNTREKVGKVKTKTLFDLAGYNGGSDTLALQASGNIFTFYTNLTPSVGSADDEDKSVMGFKALTIQAKLGNFTLLTGAHGDGIMDADYRAKVDVDAENAEGTLFELYKPGSSLGGLTTFAINEVAFKNTNRNWFAQAGYKIGLGDSASLGINVAALSNFGWNTTTLGDSNRHLGWSVYVKPEFKGILGAEVFAKGMRQDKKNEDNYGLVFGGYVKLLCLPIVTHSAIGGAVGLYDGHVEDWSANVNFRFKLGDSISLTTLNNFSMIMRVKGVKPKGDFKKDLGQSGDLAGLGKISSSAMLWDVISLRFKLSDTLAVIGTVGQQFDFDGGDQADDMELFAYPHVQVFAASNASVTAGVVFGMGGLGANKYAGWGKKADILVRIPVLFRVKM